MQEMLWLALFILLLIIEIATMGLTTIWFAGGALAAFIAGLLGCGLAVQIILTGALLHTATSCVKNVDRFWTWKQKI